MLLSGKDIADHFLKEIHNHISSRKDNLKPYLGVILVGSHTASEVYVKIKQKTLNKIGIHTELFHLPENTSQEDLEQRIKQLNLDAHIDGILLQIPLPKHLNVLKTINTIDPSKDVDGLTFASLGYLLLGKPTFVPCTPLGIAKLLEYTGISVEGKHMVIVGRSLLVGKPLAALMIQKEFNATVTIAHSYSRHLKDLTQQADILVAACGQPLFIKKDMVKKGSIVIDVGIHRVHHKIVGDVDFDEVQHIVSAITPVPGGVGPMTIAMLASNVYQSFQNRF